MNLRGKVINKYLNDTPDKFKERQKRYRPYIGYIHTERMDSLVITAYILANRDKIKKAAEHGYGNLLTPEQVVENFYTREPNSFFEACCLDMGFAITDKDIDNDCKLDFNLYDEDLDKELLAEVNRVYNAIGSHSLCLF